MMQPTVAMNSHGQAMLYLSCSRFGISVNLASL